MATRESTGAWLGSAVVHVALLAALLGQVVPPPPPVVDDPPIEIAVVELPTPSTPSSSPRIAIDTAARGLAAALSSAPPPPSPVIEPTKREVPRPPPPGVPARVDAATPEATVPVATEPSTTPTEVPAAPVAAPAITMLARPVANSGNSGNGAFGDAGGLAGDQDAIDHSAYVAAIARIVRQELDEHPVPGISELDTMILKITVLPSGELAWTRQGKYGFGEVLVTSLGRVRVSQLLKRVMIASSRFPAHPHGKRQPHYPVVIKFVFNPMP